MTRLVEVKCILSDSAFVFSVLPRALSFSSLIVFVSQANRNCLAMASTHDIQELDVSSILATQILTWIDDEETEAKT